MGKRILILGAGFGGLALANALRRGLGPEHKISVIDKSKTFMMGLVNLWILSGTKSLEESQTPLDSLTRRGIDYLNDEVIGIDIRIKKVETLSHGPIEFDYLAIALGAELAPERIDGFVGRGFNLYDPKQVPSLRKELLGLKKGRVAVSIMGAPYKCPPAPYEASMLISDLLAKNGTRQDIEIDLYAPSQISLPVAGSKVSEKVVDLLQQNRIGFHPMHRIKSVKDGGRIEFDNGLVQNYDVLVGIPPHKAPDIVAKNPDLCGDRDWIPVDPYTMKTRFEDIFAIGDVAEVRLARESLPSPMATVPKAGIFAEGQAKAVSEQILDMISNNKNGKASEKSSKFDGKGYCFMEAGGKKAGLINVDFFNLQGPAITLEPPSRESYEKKHEFERSRIREWLL